MGLKLKCPECGGVAKFAGDRIGPAKGRVYPKQCTVKGCGFFWSDKVAPEEKPEAPAPEPKPEPAAAADEPEPELADAEPDAKPSEDAPAFDPAAAGKGDTVVFDAGDDGELTGLVKSVNKRKKLLRVEVEDEVWEVERVALRAIVE